MSALDKIINENKEALREIIEVLDRYCYFEDLSDASSFEDDVYIPFQTHSYLCCDQANGATKGVLIFKNLDFVIKIPFIYCDGEELYGAGDTEDSWDYCAQEVVRYARMRDSYQVEDVFLETRFLDYANGHPIYIQQYAEPLNRVDVEEHSSHSAADEKTIDNCYDEGNWLERIDTRWEADILVIYGEEWYRKFRDAIEEYQIDDLRTANIGYRGKQPVIFDYAGFND